MESCIEANNGLRMASPGATTSHIHVTAARPRHDIMPPPQVWRGKRHAGEWCRNQWPMAASAGKSAFSQNQAPSLSTNTQGIEYRLTHA